MEYYQRPFALLHQALEQTGRESLAVHPIRKRYWQFLPPGAYALEEGRGHLIRYIKNAEDHLRESISGLSLTYLLHVYRRLSPGPIGSNREPTTIGITRAVLEAAFHKYGQFALCEHIALSGDVPISEVLGGLLLSEDFREEREGLQRSPSQLVLTKFHHTELARFYELEKLAYEIWRAGATLRCLGKGAILVVTDDDVCYGNDRDDELDYLIHHYDRRHRETNVAATGALFERPSAGKGEILLPVYNVTEIGKRQAPRLIRKLFGVRLIPGPGGESFNFVWLRYNLRAFRQVHLPLAEAFQHQHGASVDAALAVVAAISLRAFAALGYQFEYAFTRLWQRSYEGPSTLSHIRGEIQRYLASASEILGLKDTEQIKDDDLDAAIQFWSLTDEKRSNIDLAYPGPHYIFLPVGADRWFIDYAWIDRRLFDLFLGVEIGDQNYKGTALESALQSKPSALPVAPCIAPDGSEKQIDWAQRVGSTLIIAECKAVGRSIGYDRGDPRAIDYRRQNVVNRALHEADAKAKWLAKHPVGRNYDISNYEEILPVGVSPFVEFIPSTDRFYWLAPDVPRVLTPTELRDVLKRADIFENAYNRVTIERDRPGP